MPSNLQPISPKSFLKTLALLHLAFTIASFALSLIILFVLDNYIVFNIENLDSVYYILPIVALTIVYMSSVVFKNLIKSVNKNQALKDKLAKYQTASIVKYAMIEGPAVLCSVLALITGQLVFIVIAWCIIGYLYLAKPSDESVIKDLKLDINERNELGL